MVKAQKKSYPIDVLLFGAQAVMPYSQHLAQHIKQAGQFYLNVYI